MNSQTTANSKMTDLGQLLTASVPVTEAKTQMMAVFSSLSDLYKKGELQSAVHVLPFLFSLKGKPLTLRRHFMMEFAYRFNMPRRQTWKCARQISKSVNLAVSGILACAIRPHLHMLTVCPRYEQVRRFSSMYVRPILKESPIRNLVMDTQVDDSVLQRSFANGAMQFYSFAYLDCERVRGIAADWVRYDEAQDIDAAFIPVINETLAASEEVGIEQYSGTPKTFENILETMFADGSQAEWATPCTSCNHWNLASVEEDLLDMIQPGGVSCSKCGKLINPADGHFVHSFPEKRSKHESYHVPQVIMPFHYDNKEKWNLIVEAKEKMAIHLFYNEKLGESYDVASALLSRKDLKESSVLPWPNIREKAPAGNKLGSYLCRILGIDWGGGGLSEISYTTAAVLGVRPGGKMDVLYMDRLSRSLDPAEEIKILLYYMSRFKCNFLAHDYGSGAGQLRETMMVQAGLPLKQIFNVNYVRASASDMVVYHPPAEGSSRWYYSLDKARSLMVMSQLIKQKYFSFPSPYESWEEYGSDLLALVEDKHKTPSGGDVYLVTSKTTSPDDMSHSINFAACLYWHHTGKYPDMIRQIGVRITESDMKNMKPDSPTYY